VKIKLSLTPYIYLAKASKVLSTLFRPINGTAMNCLIIAVGFSQLVKILIKNAALAKFDFIRVVELHKI